MDLEVATAQAEVVPAARRARTPAAICRPGLRCGLLGLTLLSFALNGQAQIATNRDAPAEAVLQLQPRLAEAKADLARILARQGETNNPISGATTVEATEYRLMAESLVRIYQQHLDELRDLEATKHRLKDFEATARGWNGFAEPPPYSVLLVDSLRDSVRSLGAKLATSEVSRALLARFSHEAQSGARDSDEHLRLLAEQLETTEAGENSDRLNWQRTLEQMNYRLASASTALQETRLHKVEADLADSRLRLALAKRQLAFAAPHPRFSRADLDHVIARLDADRQRLEPELQAMEADNERRQQALEAARADLQKSLNLSHAAAADDPDRAAGIRKLQELVQRRTAETETSSQRLAALRQLIEIALQERGLWQLRFKSFEAHDLTKLRESYQQLDDLAGLVLSAKPYFLQQVDLSASLVAEQSNRIQNRRANPAAVEEAHDLLELNRQREEIAYRALRGLENLERLTLWWRESLDESRRALPLTGRLRDLFTEVSSFATKLWQFEIFTAEDTITVDGQPITGRRSVTVGKIVMAILILAIGYWVSIVPARWLERIAIKRMKVEPNQASLIRRWARVALILGLVVFSLVSVKIPLTVFAFLGGALAIGLGFGTQNLLKNFISGIIILFERPFRVGDVLEVGGNRGTVTGIGIRSSVLQLWDGTETLIPNSALLENNLTNWTYSNHAVRFSMSIGVAYGSDTRQVAQLLVELAGRHGLVLADPKPQVIFADFGESVLSFELRYWVDVLKSNAAQIGSDLRHMIAGAFAENGIVMSFPQRDVHLLPDHPLQVQLIRREAPPATTATRLDQRSGQGGDQGAAPSQKPNH
jgi:small-conductance mechanosensitive channel